MNWDNPQYDSWSSLLWLLYGNTGITMTSHGHKFANICIHLLRTWDKVGLVTWDSLQFDPLQLRQCSVPCRWFSYPKSWRNQRSWAEHRVAPWQHDALLPCWPQEKKKNHEIKMNCFLLKTQKNTDIEPKFQDFPPPPPPPQQNQQKNNPVIKKFPTWNVSPTKFQRLFCPRVGFPPTHETEGSQLRFWSARPGWVLKVLLNQRV